MNLCVSYHSDPLHRMLANEVRYSIAALGQALSDIEERPTMIPIIEILSLKESNIKAQKLEQICAENPSIVIDCYKIEDLHELRKFTKIKNLMYHYPVTTYNDIYFLMQDKPYAVSIAEPLTFEMPKVRKAVDSFGNEDYEPQIRVHPAIGKPTEWARVEDDNGIKHFWILPGNLNIYEPYVDTLDLYDKDSDREHALVELYSKRQSTMPIGVIVKNCSSSTLANMVDDDMAKRRLTCGQACMRNACTYCVMFEKVAQLAHPSHKEYDLKNQEKYDNIYIENKKRR